MNKLLELKTKYRQLLDYGPIPEKVKDALEEAFVESCIEYARSKVPEKVEGFSEKDSYFDVYIGHNECIDMFVSRIDQDLLSLKEKNI